PYTACSRQSQSPGAGTFRETTGPPGGPRSQRARTLKPFEDGRADLADDAYVERVEIRDEPGRRHRPVVPGRIGKPLDLVEVANRANREAEQERRHHDHADAAGRIRRQDRAVLDRSPDVAINLPERELRRLLPL